MIKFPATTTEETTMAGTTPPVQTVFDVRTVDRFRSVKCDERGHKNSHITLPAAERCQGSESTPEAQITTVSRFWGTKDGVSCTCKFGHRDRETALSCVGGLKKEATASAQAQARQAPAAPQTPPAVPTPPKRKLRSGAQGQIARA